MLLLFLLLLLLLLLLVLLLVLVVTLLLLRLLRLLLLLALAELQVVAGLVVVGIQAQALLVGLDGLAEHAVTLADEAYVMVSLRLAQVVGFHLRSLVVLHDGGRVLVLGHQRISEVVEGLRVAVVLLQSLAVADLGVGKVAATVLLVALSHIQPVRLGTHTHGHQQQCDGGYGLLLGTEQRDTLGQRVLALQQANLDDEQQEGQYAKGLELLVVVAVDGALRLLLRQLVELLVQQVLGVAVVLDVDVGTAASGSYLLTHILVEGRHHGLTRIVRHVVARSGNGDG